MGDNSWGKMFNDEDGGYSESLNSPLSGLKCAGVHCHDKWLSSGNDDIFLSGGTWTNWFSSNRQWSMPCGDGRLIKQIQCKDDHCEKLRLLCTELIEPYEVAMWKTEITDWISSDASSSSQQVFCPEGYFAHALQCKGHRCERLRMYCKMVKREILRIRQSSTDFTLNDCGGVDLATHYKTVHGGQSISNHVGGDCQTKTADFLHKNAQIELDNIQWIKVAGKGLYAEPENPTHTELSQDRTRSSMNRAAFEELWSQSNQVLLRRCKWCTETHRYIYLKRHDTNELLPPNVDLLNDVKENWKQYENNIVHIDFDLYSTYDDAIESKGEWNSVNSDYNVGFPRDSGPNGFVYNQWNIWENPLQGKHGQKHVAFYVALNTSSIPQLGETSNPTSSPIMPTFSPTKACSLKDEPCQRNADCCMRKCSKKTKSCKK